MPTRPPSNPGDDGPDAPGPVCFYRPTHSHSLLADVDSGDADAQFNLGRLYFQGRAESHTGGSFTPGVPRNPLAAATLLRKAADQGHVEARHLLEVVKLEIKDEIQ